MSVVNITGGELSGIEEFSDTPQGNFKINGRMTGGKGLSNRIELCWIGGKQGKPGINADIQDLTEVVRMIADPEFEVQGTNAVSAGTTFNASGGIDFTTAGALGDSIIVVPHQDANQSAWKQFTWNTNKELVWECSLKTSTVVDTILWAGLKLTSSEAVAADAEQVFFRYENGANNDNWTIVYSVGGVDTILDTGVNVVASTIYDLKLYMDSVGKVTCMINNRVALASAQLTFGQALLPFVGCLANAAAAKSVIVLGQAISGKRG